MWFMLNIVLIKALDTADVDKDSTTPEEMGKETIPL